MLFPHIVLSCLGSPKGCQAQVNEVWIRGITQSYTSFLTVGRLQAFHLSAWTSRPRISHGMPRGASPPKATHPLLSLPLVTEKHLSLYPLSRPSCSRPPFTSLDLASSAMPRAPVPKCGPSSHVPSPVTLAPHAYLSSPLLAGFPLCSFCSFLEN